MCVRAPPVIWFPCVQLMAQNLRGEVSLDFAGTKLCLSDSRFIQVIAKSLSISCKEVGEMISFNPLDYIWIYHL